MSIVEFFLPIYRLKELFRQGWIGKVPLSEIESVAEHSYAVASLALCLVPIENSLRKQSKGGLKILEKAKIIEKCLIHDLSESQYLDMDRSFVNILGKETYNEFKNLLDTTSEQKIQSNFNNLAKSIFSLENSNILPEMNNSTSEEDEFVKLLDVLELFFQTKHYFKKNFISEDNAKPFLESTKEKIHSFAEKFLIVTFIETT